MIDSHCHLTDPKLFDQLDEVIARANSAGVTRIITIGTSLDESEAAIAVARAYANVRATVGIHPGYCEESQFEDIAALRPLFDDPGVVAMGEIGLDYHYPGSDLPRQKQFFEQQLQIARELRRPVVIHCREAVDDTLAGLRNFSDVACLFHCFTGTVDEAKKILEAGHMLGFTGPITFKKSDELREVVKLSPRDRTVVETDAPWLSPEPMRKQKINEPALVVHVAEVVAKLWGIDVSEVDRITTENVERFFGWTSHGHLARGK